MRVALDLETYSRVNLKLTGVHPYVADRDFQVLLAGYRVGGDVVVEEGVSEQLRGLLADPGNTFVAHNAAFDRICLGAVLGYQLDPEQWECSMAMAAEAGLPQKLEKLAKKLGGEQKDPRGETLVQFFCKPDRKGNRRLPADYPEEWAEFVEYCRQDVVALHDLDTKLAWPTPMERRVYQVDQSINDRGFRVDRKLAVEAVAATEYNMGLLMAESKRLTGLANPNSNEQLLRWLRSTGLSIGDVTKESVAKALSGDLSPVQRRVLEIRAETAGTAIKKFPAALKVVSPDSRIRGAFRFFGAHTGRWTGQGFQPHNLAREHFDDPADEERAIRTLLAGVPVPLLDLKKLVRPLITGPFTVVDYSSIEARVIAWLAGEQWALAAFRDKRDIYVETAERMGGLTRAQGKVAVLALGFAGAINSLKAMWDSGKMPMPSDEELLVLVRAWRRANPAIVTLWAQLEEAFRTGGPAGDYLVVEKDGRDRRLRLPSGRAIGYYECRWDATSKGMRATFLDWRYGRTDTYGGRLTENAVQAVARDIMAEALVRLHDLGYPVAAHTHDEIIVEGSYDVDLIADIMCQELWWSEGLPIDAAGFNTDRYRKE